MALLFMDGFDHYTTNADLAKKYNYVTTTYPVVVSNAGRRGGGALRTENNVGYAIGKTISDTQTIIVGLAIKLNGSDTSLHDILSLYDTAAGNRQITVVLDSNSGKIKVYNGSTIGTLLLTSTATLAASVWTYVELKVKIDNSTGTINLQINGVADSSASSVDTQNTANAYANQVRIYGALQSASYIDDFYICNTSGATNNDFLGDIRVDTIYPDGDGNYTQFTPSTGTAHWSLVDETTPNTTDYNSGANVGDRDSYTYAALSAITSQTIHGVQINAAVLKSDSGSRSLGTMSRLSGTNKDGSGAALSTSQTYISEIQETDPASAAWTESNINSAEFGVKVTA